MALDRSQVTDEQNYASQYVTGSTAYYTWKTGANRGRILPPWPGAGKLAVMRFKHFALPGEQKMQYCYQKQSPNAGFVCPICVEIANARKRGINADRQDSDAFPTINWVDRTADVSIGPQVAEIRMKVYTQLLNVFLNTGCDLTSLDLGYDIIVTHTVTNQRASYDAQVVPGAPTPLHTDPAVCAHWIQKASQQDLRNYIAMPDWQSPDGQKIWNKLTSAARALAHMYTGSVSVGGPSQTFGGNPAPPPPPAGNPYGQTAPQQQFAPPPQQQFAPPPQQQFAPPPQQPQAPPSQPAPYQQPAQSYQPQPQSPAPQYQAPPPQPHAPAPAPVQQTLMPVAPVTSTVATSALDTHPPCYGRSFKDHSINYQNIPGGWNDHPSDPARSMRCGACAHELQCKDAAIAAYPADYNPFLAAADDDIPF